MSSFGQARVDDELSARDVARLIGSQEYHRVGDIDGLDPGTGSRLWAHEYFRGVGCGRVVQVGPQPSVRRLVEHHRASRPDRGARY